MIAFLALLAFAPTALYALALYSQSATGIAATKQALLEQQAITVREQDFEESFWRVVNYSAPRREVDAALSEWAGVMRVQGVEPWHGPTGGSAAAALKSPPRGFADAVMLAPSKNSHRLAVVRGNSTDALGATITAGGSKGVYLIPQGCSIELS